MPLICRCLLTGPGSLDSEAIDDPHRWVKGASVAASSVERRLLLSIVATFSLQSGEDIGRLPGNLTTKSTLNGARIVHETLALVKFSWKSATYNHYKRDE